MNELFCWRCNSNQLKRYTRETIIYQCKRCGEYFRASQVKDFLLEEVVKETKKLGQLDVCPTCGRELSEPNWCSWCGKLPYSVEDEITKLNEQIRAIEVIIESDAVEDRKILAENQAQDHMAREGDFQSLSHIFGSVIYDDSDATGAKWKRLIDVGSPAVPFLINQLEGDTRKRKVAIGALIKIGDERAVASLVKALSPKTNDGLDHAIMEALKTQWGAIIPLYVGELLNKIYEILTIIKPEDSYKRGVLKDTLQLVESILVHAASGISENDLQAISAMKDISLLESVGTGHWVHGDDGWGYLDYEETRDVAKTIDCSSMREAAQMEIRRRTLK